MSDNSDRMKIVIWYAAWATVCAAVAGVVVALVHTWFFSYTPTPSARVGTLIEGIETSLALAAGQGAVILVTGSLHAQFGRGLQGTVLLGLLLGLFDFVMYFLQMWIPALELGWVPDIAILVAVTVAITLFGVQRTAPSPQKSSQTPS
ncbi:MAG: hypothetical protein E6J87_14340 [Deltaproteobacteria bacterium]|nr:MAG: hypothetical protein E6J87_14340 [Deltaproteobacteria bacterium]